MNKQKGRFITLDRNSKRSTFKLIVYWNEYAKTDVSKTTFYSYDKFDTLNNTYDKVYALEKLIRLTQKFSGQYKTMIIYDNQEEQQHKQELMFISAEDHRIFFRNKHTAKIIQELMNFCM